MNDSRFDAFTKALATSTSRRRALRRIGGTLTGAILASLLPGRVLADNSACAHFCASVFGADTPAADQCTSDAAHGTGLCFVCGPASPGGGVVCPAGNFAPCCPTGFTCCSGAVAVTRCCPAGHACGDEFCP